MAPVCPKCRTPTLEPARGSLAEADKPVGTLVCWGCRGLWVPREVIEFWQHDPFVEFVAGESLAPPPDEDHRTGLCPSGHGIMIRARVEAPTPFYLESCPLCRGVWFDRGEWQLLATRDFLDHLDDLWDPLWKKQQRAEARQKELDQALGRELGSELFAELEHVAGALADHPARAQALAWLVKRLQG